MGVGALPACQGTETKLGCSASLDWPSQKLQSCLWDRNFSSVPSGFLSPHIAQSNDPD